MSTPSVPLPPQSESGQAGFPQPPKLWNPNAACLWSLIFTPIFGALVHSKNWRSVGEPSRARTSMLWAWATVLYILITSVLDAPRFSGVVFLLAWYLSSGSSQIRFVAQNYGTEYEKKSWVLPLMIAIVGYGTLIALSVASLALIESLPPPPPQNQ